jgi:hypothetical protein
MCSRSRREAIVVRAGSTGDKSHKWTQKAHRVLWAVTGNGLTLEGGGVVTMVREAGNYTMCTPAERGHLEGCSNFQLFQV